MTPPLEVRATEGFLAFRDSLLQIAQVLAVLVLLLQWKSASSFLSMQVVISAVDFFVVIRRHLPSIRQSSHRPPTGAMPRATEQATTASETRRYCIAQVKPPSASRS